jgi:hypothetical protein
MIHVMAPRQKQKQTADKEIPDEAQTFCTLCWEDHSASLTSQHKKGLAQPGAIATALLEQRFVDIPESKRARYGRRVPAEVSDVPHALDGSSFVNGAVAVEDSGADHRSSASDTVHPPVNLDPEDVLREHAGPRVWGNDKDEDEEDHRQTHEGGEQEQDVPDDLYNAAEDDEVAREVWMAEREEAAKRDVQDFGEH